MKKWVFLTILMVGLLFTGPPDIQAATETNDKYHNSEQLGQIYDNLVDLEISNPQIVLSQIILETGYLRSSYVSKYNNVLGFELNGQPLKFTSISDCLSYYKDWQIRYFNRTSVIQPDKNYYSFLDSLMVTKTTRVIRYATASKYTQTLKQLETVTRHIVEQYSETHSNDKYAFFMQVSDYPLLEYNLATSIDNTYVKANANTHFIQAHQPEYNVLGFTLNLTNDMLLLYEVELFKSYPSTLS